MRSSAGPSLRHTMRSDPSRRASKTGSRTSRSPSPTRPSPAPMRSRGGSGRSERAPFRPRTDAARRLEMEQILADVVIPSPPEPADVEAFRRDAGEGDVEAGLKIVVHQERRVATPQRGEDSEPEFLRDPIHS